MKSQKLPKIDSIQELASFWDTHDLTDFDDDLEEVQEAVFDRDSTITLHLDRDEVNAVRRLAKSQGVAETALIENWVREKIGLK
jgi:hypothetical protein